jgi:hypothetical protein
MSGVGERGFGSCSQLPKGALNRGAPTGQKLIQRWVRRGEHFFRRQSRTLCHRESLSTRVGEKPVRAPHQMHKVKTRRCGATWFEPELINRKV